MKLGFSTLSLFMKTFDEMFEIAIDNGFEMIELLSEGPYNAEYLLKDKKLLDPFFSYDLELNIHGPTVDLNLASINEGIRYESLRQIKKTIDLGSLIGANFITLHPGQIGRKDDRLREVAIDFSIESIKECVSYSSDLDLKISVENMPNKFKFLGTSPEEIAKISKLTGSHITIDTGHANTCQDSEKFYNLENISYCHINDNNGKKDQHITLGEGTFNLDLLNKIDNGIIELNNFDNVLKSKKVILEYLAKN